MCGRVPTVPPQTTGCLPYERGEFAVAATDMGHRDPSAASWGGDPERRLDFAHRAQHLTARMAKLLLARFYGEGPRQSYFAGCSDGGREGLMAARLYPEDFDGIAAGAPALDFTVQNTVHHGWTVRRNRRADGSAVLTADRLPTLHRLVLAACGDPDGVVADPLRCGFDPLRHVGAPGADPASWLTAEEARAAAALYDGPRDAGGRAPVGRRPPPRLGGELGRRRRARATRPHRRARCCSRPACWATSPSRRAVATYRRRRVSPSTPPPSTVSPTASGPSTRPRPTSALSSRAAGGCCSGTGSPTRTSRRVPTLAWWHALRRDQGAARVDAAARLFLVPGLAHCRGGAGKATAFDTLTPLLRWVEEGAAPGTLADRVAPTGDVAPEPFLGSERFGPRH